MKFTIGVFVSTAALLTVLAGCAANPPAPAPAGNAAIPVATATVATAATATDGKATESPVAATAAAASPAEAFKPPPGFKARKRKGEIVYCRTVVVTGSQFPQEQCWPPEQLEAALAKQKESSQRLLRQQRGCRGSECVSAPPTR